MAAPQASTSQALPAAPLEVSKKASAKKRFCVRNNWAKKVTEINPNPVNEFEAKLSSYFCTKCDGRVTEGYTMPNIGRAFNKVDGSHHWQTCPMTLVGGLTPANLASRDELCREEAAHMATLKPTNPKKRETNEPPTTSRSKRRKIEVVPLASTSTPVDQSRAGTPTVSSSRLQTPTLGTPTLLSPEPVSLSSISPGAEIEVEETIPEIIRCMCDHPLEHGFMMACDKCHTWQHGPCIGLESEDQIPRPYYCQFCVPPESYARETSFMSMVETGLAERGALINPGSGFSMLLEAAEEKAGLPRLYDPPLTARTVFSDGTNSAARTAAATMPPPTKGLGCEMCRKESELAWRVGPAGKRLLCPGCGEIWSKTLAKKLDVYGLDSDEEAMEDKQDSFSHLALPEPPASFSQKKPFLTTAKPRGPIYQSLEAAYQHQTGPSEKYIAPKAFEQIALARFLENLNPGMGQTAGTLIGAGIKSEGDVKRLSAAAWDDICQTRIRGLSSLDHFLLGKVIGVYIAKHTSV